MNQTTIFRIYVPTGASFSDPRPFWKRLFSSTSLSFRLVQEAKKFGIEQAGYFQAQTGYLKGKSVVSNLSEVPPSGLPILVELVGDEGRVRNFISTFRDQLKVARIFKVNSTEEI